MAEEIFERLQRALADRYRLDRVIGRGGMATVYLAEDLKHHRQVAIKVLSPDLAAALGADRFLREIELAAKLQHPHIVPVYDSGSGDGILYYVMPFVEGESLRELLRREGRIPLARAAEIVCAAASGLAYAHAQGVVHRDVKPENIMMSAGHAMVTDFGIARAISASRQDANLTGAGMAMGTPAYMSPEQATADAVDARTDQYALACVFYEMLTGQQPFKASTMQAMLTSILTAARPRLAASVQGIPPAVDIATQRALAADPSKRFGNISEFAQAVAQESSGAAAATRESRRWKKLAIGLPALVAVVAGAYVALFAKPKTTVVSGAETIAVVPFTTSGPGLEGMSEGMVDLLSPSLEGVGVIRTAKPRTVLSEWRKRTRENGSTLDDALAVARAVKAASVLTGSIVSTGGTARITAELYDLDGKSLAKATVSGRADSVLILADNLALSLLQEIWRSRDPLPSANVALINSTSMPAIRAYLRGESFHRRGVWDSAQVAFEEAAQADSTFALAWYRLATILGWQGQYGGAAFLAAAVKAEQYSKGLSPRLRLLMVGYRLFAEQDVTATDSLVSYTRQFPHDADGWFLLGESQYHTVGYRPLAPDQLRAPFDKVLQIDSMLTPAAIHPMELALQTGDTALLRRYEAVLRSGGDSSGTTRLTEARAFLLGADSMMGHLTHNALGLGATRAALSGRLSASDMTGEGVVRLARLMSMPGVGGIASDQMRVTGAQMMVGIGRRDLANSENIGVTIQGSEMSRILRNYPVLMGYGDSTDLARADSAFEAAKDQNPYVRVAHSIVTFDRGNFAKTASLAKSVAPKDSSAELWLRGAAQVMDGLTVVAQGDTLHGMLRADSGMRMIGGIPNQLIANAAQIRYAQVELARPQTRARGIARLRYSFPLSFDMIPVNTLRIAKAYESAEVYDSAATHYRRFLAFFNAPDSAFASLMADAKAGLARTVERGSVAPVKPR